MFGKENIKQPVLDGKFSPKFLGWFVCLSMGSLYVILMSFLDLFWAESLMGVTRWHFHGVFSFIFGIAQEGRSPEEDPMGQKKHESDPWNFESTLVFTSGTQNRFGTLSKSLFPNF